jgi:hypothetical protein
MSLKCIETLKIEKFLSGVAVEVSDRKIIKRLEIEKKRAELQDVEINLFESDANKHTDNESKTTLADVRVSQCNIGYDIWLYPKAKKRGSWGMRTILRHELYHIKSCYCLLSCFVNEMPQSEAEKEERCANRYARRLY